MNRIALALALTLALVACKTESAQQGAPSAAPSAATAPAASAAPEKPWYVGAWSGDYSAELFKVETGPGAVKDWAKDDGSKASGPGKLTLRISDEGEIVGETQGSLGTLDASGRVDGETVRVTLRAADSAGFYGFLVGTRADGAIKGRLQASSGDSLTVRQAAVELKKQSP